MPPDPAFTPDTSLPVTVRPSPNHGERKGVPISILVLHYTGMRTAEDALARLCQPDGEVSAHYVVLEDGGLIQCVPEARRAWHAGAGSWDGETDVNSASIGIEIVNPGHEFGYRDFPPAQIEAVIALARDIAWRHRIRPHRIIAHSDMAPARKQDPGERFPWEQLHRAGVGLWVSPAPLSDPDASRLSVGEVRALQAALHRCGYAIAVTGEYDAATADVVRAFQRHFRPARIDGIADLSTRSTLNALLTERVEF